MSLTSNVISGLRWNLVAKLMGQVFTWASTLIVIRILTPEDYGLVAISGAIVSFGMILTELGLGSAIVYSDDIGRRLRQVFTISATACTVLFLATWASAGLLADWFANPTLATIIPVQSLLLLLSIFLIIPASLLTKAMRFKLRSMVEMAAALAGTVCTLSLALSGAGVWSLILGHLAAQAVRVFLFNIYYRGVYLPTLDFSNFDAFGRYSFFNFLNQLLYFLYQKMDVLIIGRLMSIEVLGVYQIANNLAAMPLSKIGSMLNDIGLSAFSKIKQDAKSVSYYFLAASAVAAIVSLPVFIGIASIAREFVPLVLGERWLDVIMPLTILAFAVPMRALLLLVNVLLDGIGRPEVGTKNLATCCVLIPIGMLSGIQYGLVGVCFGLVAAYSLHFLLALRRVLPLIGVAVGSYLRTIMLPVAAAVTMFVVVRLFAAADFGLGSVMLIGAEVLVGACCYILLMHFFLDSRHRDLLIRVLLGKKGPVNA